MGKWQFARPDGHFLPSLDLRTLRIPVSTSLGAGIKKVLAYARPRGWQSAHSSETVPGEEDRVAIVGGAAGDFGSEVTGSELADVFHSAGSGDSTSSGWPVERLDG
jgi:hypothetical protein